MPTGPVRGNLGREADGGRLIARFGDKIAARPFWLASGGLLLVGTLLSFAWLTSGPLIDELSQVENSRLPRIALLQAARNEDLRASLSLRNALLLQDAKPRALELRRYGEAAAAAEAALASFGELIRRPGERAMWHNVLLAREELLAARKVVTDDIARGGEGQDMVSVLENAIAPYLDALTYLQDHGDNRLRTMIDILGLRSQSLRLWLTAAGLAAAATVLLIGWSWRQHLAHEVRSREERIASLLAQKEGLVREVHHRIKNHLQGLLGLLEVHRRDAEGEEAALLGTLHGHVLALIGFHGLQAASELEGIPLADLVQRQVALARTGFTAGSVEIADTAPPTATLLHGDQAVTVALVLTELIVNAMKHGLDETAHVAVVRGPDGTPGVSVRNRVQRVPLFDLQTGTGLGTGLTLALTMTLEVGELHQQRTADEVEVILWLTALRGT